MGAASSLSSSTTASLSSYQTTSVSKHYALNDKILTAFRCLYENKTYTLAYAMGMQFVEVALLEIPKHGYFYADRHHKERVQNAQHAREVLSVLSRLQDEDSFRDVVTEEDRVQLQRLEQLAREQPTSDKSRYEQERIAVKEDMTQTGLLTFCASQMTDYQEMIAAICSGKSNSNDLEPTGPPRRPSRKDEEQKRDMQRLMKEEPAVVSTGRKKRSTSINTTTSTTQPGQLEKGWSLVQDVKVEEADKDGRDAPPGEEFWLVQGTTEVDLDRALFLSGMMDVDVYPNTCEQTQGDAPNRVGKQQQQQQNQPPVTSANDNTGGDSGGGGGGRRRRKSQTAIDMYTLQLCYAEDFDLLRERQRIRISQSDTYQGRIVGSINGCTVIAPLLCIYHLHNNDGSQSGDMGLPDRAISEVIDTDTPAILPQVRDQLGLTKDALIIPSDVHDFLMDRELLSPQQFVTVCGGNILDHAHVSAFAVELIKVAQQRKCGATFFFHEHVVAILPMRRDGGNALWFDWIDSLPTAKTLRREEAWGEFVPNAARIRCVDEEALQATILWHACSKFTDENKAYIDTYDWDDAHSDFDPRVFQAFIWAEMEE